MNERVKELAQQAGVLADYGEDIKKGRYSIGGSYQSMEKFAELIVKECIEQASIGNGHGNNQWDRALTFASKNIKEHFGVESA